jgi:membrane-bound metal-dependent hydrolase YbcI (DUF457 family)
MDNVTHTLFALTLARTPLGQAGRGSAAVLILASNAPDVDIVTTVAGTLNYLEWHRGPTHGPLGIVALGVTAAIIVWLAQRWLARTRAEGAASFQALLALGIVGGIGHVLMDLPTSYGTRPLSPFDWHWFAADLMPIVDIYLLAVLASGLFFGWLGARKGQPAARGRNAAIALVLMFLNYGVRATAHHEALETVPGIFGPLLPAPCENAHQPSLLIDRWPADVQPTLPPPGSVRCLIETAALPTFFSPFSWRLLLHTSSGYELRDVNLLDRHVRQGERAPWRIARRVPNQWTPDVVRAANTDVGRVFLGFSRFPSARSVVNRDGITTVQWTDMRFLNDVRQTGGGTRNDGFFTATVQYDRDGNLITARLGGIEAGQGRQGPPARP